MLNFSGVGVSFGTRRVLDQVSFALAPHKLTALVGRNGSGKSTLISCMNREISYTGTITISGKDIALICDAGTPGLSDPGADIVKSAIEQNIEVIAIPGASALLTAFTVSGLNSGSFCFEGFLPRERGNRRKALQALAQEQRVMVFYEAPHRLLAVLEDMAAIWEPSRQIAVCRELTKMFEEKRRGTIEEMIAHFNENAPRGEFTLVVAGQTEEDKPIDWHSIEMELEAMLGAGVSRKEASKQLAEKYHIKSKDIYALGLK